jgi:hypothetical protein
MFGLWGLPGRSAQSMPPFIMVAHHAANAVPSGDPAFYANALRSHENGSSSVAPHLPEQMLGIEPNLGRAGRTATRVQLMDCVPFSGIDSSLIGYDARAAAGCHDHAAPARRLDSPSSGLYLEGG